MDKSYDPHSIESKWYQDWENNGYFVPKANDTSYCIMLPPPNVTGSLHMGHGFQHTLMDALSRYHRMQGYSTLWQPGTDHAGISTQMVVERQLEKQGKSRHQFERQAFVEKIWQWKETSGGRITSQLRRMGSSVDWSKERFTMDEGLSKAVTKVFVQLHQDGLIYRGKRLVNWDPVFTTAISDLEVIAEEEQGHLWHIRYPLEQGNGELVIATTRPETLLGDSAVAVHPEDERYQHLIGQNVLLPLCNRSIPIIADEYVDRDFGSGCVKITPAHDFNDYEVGQRHQLPMLNILTKTARINENAPKAYQGLDRFEARKKIIQDLSELELLLRIDDHKLSVPRGEKSGAIIEPYLTDQWYVKIAPLAKPAIEAVEKGEIRFVPETWTKTYFQWMHNLQDWCISRQLWWGHRIPAWYDEQGNVFVGYSERDVRFKYQLDDDITLQQDEDVLDTWFSSALWPFSTLGWPEKTAEFEKFYPTSVLVTGFDIIFFWVARMVMMGLKFTGQVPFKEVYITGLIRDAEGKKMSKSKGNVLDPIDLIDGIALEPLLEKRTSNLMLDSAKNKIIKQTKKEFPNGIPAFGTDALRFTFCALASTGRDIRFDLGRIEGYRNFCNKLWNAARYVLMNTENVDKDWEDGAFQYSDADKWILSRLQNTIEKAHQYFASYRFDLLANTLYDFIWHEYCDWYLELSKPILYGKNILEALKRGTRRTLLQVLEKTLRLIHPIMPFISEEIWQRVAPLTSQNGETIMLQSYPEVQAPLINLEIEANIAWLKTVILGIRNIRGEMNISPNKPLHVYLQKGNQLDAKRLQLYQDALHSLANLEAITWLGKNDQAPISATALAGEMEILIPMTGLIDKEKELARLKKEMEKINKDLLRTSNKLNNANFIDKAPPEVVEKEQKRLKELKHALASFEQQYLNLEQL